MPRSILYHKISMHGLLHVTTPVKNLYIPKDEEKIIITNLPLEETLNSQDIAQNVAVCYTFGAFPSYVCVTLCQVKVNALTVKATRNRETTELHDHCAIVGRPVIELNSFKSR